MLTFVVVSVSLYSNSGVERMSGNDEWPFVHWPFVRVAFCPLAFCPIGLLSWSLPKYITTTCCQLPRLREVTGKRVLWILGITRFVGHSVQALRREKRISVHGIQFASDSVVLQNTPLCLFDRLEERAA